MVPAEEVMVAAAPVAADMEAVVEASVVEAEVTVAADPEEEEVINFASLII